MWTLRNLGVARIHNSFQGGLVYKRVQSSNLKVNFSHSTKNRCGAKKVKCGAEKFSAYFHTQFSPKYVSKSNQKRIFDIPFY